LIASFINKPMKKSTLILMSGGLDSYACAHFMQNEGHDVEGLFIDHGQLAAYFENSAAAKIAALLRIPLSTLKITGGAEFGMGELIGRNAFLIDAALFLSKRRSGLIVIGIHGGTSYYDCSPPFLARMNELIGEQTNGTVKVLAPFLDWTKREIFEYAKLVGLNLTLTYSCEKGMENGCNECASCADRKVLNAR
jgi:7-cyano-7-deazaguanine synthase